MKYKTYLTQIKSKFLKKKTVIRDPQLMHPEREWAIGLCIAVIIFSLCGLWSIYAYLKNRAASALPAEDATAQVVYRESVVKDALEIVNRRAQALEKLTSGPSAAPIVVEEVASTSQAAVEIVEPVVEVEPNPLVPVSED